MNVSVSSNANQIAADLGAASVRTVRRVSVTIAEAAIDMRDEWRSNLAESAGAHGKHAPKSIRYKMDGPLAATIYPDESMKQGGMSWEFGSVNQPPHLDGQRALDALAPRIERRIASQVVF